MLATVSTVITYLIHLRRETTGFKQCGVSISTEALLKVV
jgi:hypothetical protein